MSVIGAPTDWAGLIDPMVPVILRLVLESWAELLPLPEDREDDITIALCRALKQNRTARDLMFTIDTQMAEIEPEVGEDMGRMDITFRPLVPREDIYFCLEGKRLNVVKDDKVRPYASEYVRLGMARFVSGQYAKAVRHGGMAGYVLDGDIVGAISSVAANIRTHHAALGMDTPGELMPSTVLTGEERARQTAHRRQRQDSAFLIHHLFMAVRA